MNEEDKDFLYGLFLGLGIGFAGTSYLYEKKKGGSIW